VIGSAGDDFRRSAVCDFFDAEHRRRQYRDGGIALAIRKNRRRKSGEYSGLDR